MAVNRPLSPGLDVLDRDREKFLHGPANLMLGLLNAGRLEIRENLAHDILVAGLGKIRRHHVLEIGFDVGRGLTELFSRPGRKPPVPARHGAESQFLVMSEFLLKALFAPVEGRHISFPRKATRPSMTRAIPLIYPSGGWMPSANPRNCLRRRALRLRLAVRAGCILRPNAIPPRKGLDVEPTRGPADFLFLEPRLTAMNRRRRIYEGKAKVLYEGPEPGTLVQHFKDDATAFNAKKHEVIDGKGVLNNRISEFIFQHLNNIGVPTHFIRRLNMREQLIREVEIVPLEVVVRNVAAGSLAQRLGIEEGTQLPRSIIEFYYKNDALNDPMVSEEHITAFGWASPQEIDDIMALAIRVNDFLSGLFLGVGIRLVDFKMECGRLWENDMMRIVVADEISPDSCRLWDIKSNDKLDKDRFRRDMGGLVEAYTEVARRLGILQPDDANRGSPKLVQ